MSYLTWKLWRRVNRLEAVVEEMRNDVGSVLQEHESEIAASRRDIDDIKRSVEFLETQAGVMDVDGIGE